MVPSLDNFRATLSKVLESVSKPELLGFIDKNSADRAEHQDISFLRKKYPFAGALGQVSKKKPLY